MRNRMQRKVRLWAMMSALVLPMAAYGAQGAGSIAKAPDKAASENPCLKYAPADWWMMGNIDVKTLINFVANDQGVAPAQQAMIKQYLALAQLFTGIDLTKDIDYAMVFAAGDPDKNPAGLFVLKGALDEATVSGTLGKLAGAPVEKSVENGQTVYANETFAFAFPEEGTLLAGSPAVVKAAAAKAKGKANLPPTVMQTLERTNAAAILWFAVKPKTVLGTVAMTDFRGTHPNLVKNLSTLDCISACAVPVDDGLYLSAQAAASGAPGAKSVYDYLSQQKVALMTKDGVNTMGMSALIISELENSEQYVRGSLKITAAAILDLWNTKTILKPER